MHLRSVWQSESPLQLVPSAHLFGHAPPQSTSASLASNFALEQVSVSLQVPKLQKKLWQSELILQDFPKPHFADQGPPQSTSPSFWSLIPSLQVCSLHFPLKQNLLAHSELSLHASFTLHVPLLLHVIIGVTVAFEVQLFVLILQLLHVKVPFTNVLL